MITKHPWFGPKRIGWGWTPVSWEGWAVTALIVAAAAAACAVFGPAATVYVAIGAIGAIVVACLLTGTPPG